MPTLKNKRRAYLPEPRTPFEGAERSKHTRKRIWTDKSVRYRKEHPLCEVHCYFLGHDHTAAQNIFAEHVDHIIRWQNGGAFLDDRNLMGMTAELSNFKTGKEQHNPIMVETMKNERGELIPRDRKEIMKIFAGKF